MITWNWHSLPSRLLILIGAWLGIGRTYHYLTSTGDGLGFLPEVALVTYVLFGSGVIAVGIFTLLNDNPHLSLSVLVGLVTLKLTFLTDFYRLSANTQFIVSLGVIVVIVASITTWYVYEPVMNTVNESLSNY